MQNTISETVPSTASNNSVADAGQPKTVGNLPTIKLEGKNKVVNESAKDVNEEVEEYLRPSRAIDIKGGNMFPYHTSQQMWQFSLTPGHLHFYDGKITYSFRGGLNPEIQSTFEKISDVPLSDMFDNSVEKGDVQIHRSTPGSLYFTFQRGGDNPSYTLRHSSGTCWVAIPKPCRRRRVAQPKAAQQRTSNE
jgi:hypothetical protein